MKYLYLSLITILFLSCTTTKKVANVENATETEITTPAVEEDKLFILEVVQDGKVIPVNDGVVLVEKKPFKYQLTFIDTDGVFVSNSTGRYFYDFPFDENMLECNPDKDDLDKECRFHGYKTFAEELYNEEQDIFISNVAHSYWYYNTDYKNHRMDKELEFVNGRKIATVTVAKIGDTDNRDADDNIVYTSVNDFDKDIYVVAAAGDIDEQIEYQREKFIIRFK